MLVSAKLGEFYQDRRQSGQSYNRIIMDKVSVDLQTLLSQSHLLALDSCDVVFKSYLGKIYSREIPTI